MKLIIQPEAGVVPIVHAIKAARKWIDILIFRFDRGEVEKALTAAVQRGVKVRALIAHTNRGGEARLRKLEQRLLAAGVLVSRSADDLLRYHAKFMVVDSTTLHLFGFNFTKLDIDQSRSFAISTNDARAVAEAVRLFESDLTRQVYTPAKSHLVVSPENARAMLSAFISSTRKELAIYDSKVQDPSMIKLLKERAARGVRVRIIGDMKGKVPGIEERRLPMRLHVRAIVSDGTRAFVGSQSLRKDELENRREVGLIINNPAVARKIQQVFESDWADSGKAAKKRAA
ncbi:MAG: phosphatidylserine synthase [Cyanobacteria bacterium]|nr:phosphatidylserine synthase [Cyanobacteriota bacterium]